MDAPGNGDTVGRSPVDGEDTGGRDAVDRIVSLLGLRLDEMRSLADEATARWRGDRIRVGEGTRRRVRELARELGLVTREDWDELELRVAQLEHRLRLLERGADET